MLETRAGRTASMRVSCLVAFWARTGLARSVFRQCRHLVVRIRPRFVAGMVWDNNSQEGESRLSGFVHLLSPRLLGGHRGVRSLSPVSPFTSLCQKGFASWILCNRFPVPASILAARVTRGLQEPSEIKEQRLKGHGRSPRGSACSSTAAKSAG